MKRKIRVNVIPDGWATALDIIRCLSTAFALGLLTSGEIPAGIFFAVVAVSLVVFAVIINNAGEKRAKKAEESFNEIIEKYFDDRKLTAEETDILKEKAIGGDLLSELMLTHISAAVTPDITFEELRAEAGDKAKIKNRGIFKFLKLCGLFNALIYAALSVLTIALIIVMPVEGIILELFSFMLLGGFLAMFIIGSKKVKSISLYNDMTLIAESIKKRLDSDELKNFIDASVASYNSKKEAPAEETETEKI